jgi:hypothetical protein
MMMDNVQKVNNCLCFRVSGPGIILFKQQNLLSIPCSYLTSLKCILNFIYVFQQWHKYYIHKTGIPKFDKCKFNL